MVEKPKNRCDFGGREPHARCVVEPGDVIECTVYAEDSMGATISSRANLVVENSAPILKRGLLIFRRGVSDSEINCEAEARDPNGDTPELSISGTEPGFDVVGAGSTPT